MLNAIPTRWFSWNFIVKDGPRELARIDMSAWREKGVLTVDGVEYRVYREGAVSGDFVLKSGGTVLARAEKPSVFRREFIIKHKDAHYTLRPKSAFRRAFVLSRGSSELGFIAPQGHFSRRLAIDLPDDLPVPVQVFTVWLMVILLKRDAQHAS